MSMPYGAFGNWTAYLAERGVAEQLANSRPGGIIPVNSPYDFAALVSRPLRDKCASCGSREFREHHGQSVCTYCRGTA